MAFSWEIAVAISARREFFVDSTSLTVLQPRDVMVNIVLAAPCPAKEFKILRHVGKASYAVDIFCNLQVPRFAIFCLESLRHYTSMDSLYNSTTGKGNYII
jgi:hypothetical protein